MGQASEEPEGLDAIYGEGKIRDGGERQEWRQAGPYFPWTEPGRCSCTGVYAPVETEP